MPETMELEKKSKFENVDNFDYVQHEGDIPESIRPALLGMFERQDYGWKARARQVLKIARAKQEVARLETDLTTLCTAGRASRTPKTPEASARASLRNFLVTLDEAKLQHICAQHNVSYPAFEGDPANLIEAIIDEMLSV